jgi:hypothetical protein
MPQITIQNPDLHRFYNFSRMKITDQCSQLEQEGILVDTDRSADHIMKLYFLRGFFIEQQVDHEGTVLENIPFRQGYRLSLFFHQSRYRFN